MSTATLRREAAAFTGTSVDEALGAAVAALGPETHIDAVRRVRRGFGRLAKEWYEVRASVRPGGSLAAVADDASDAVAHPAEGAVDDALDALLDVADAREEIGAAGSWLSARAAGPDASPGDDFAALVAQALRRVEVVEEPEQPAFAPAPVSVPHPAPDVCAEPVLRIDLDAAALAASLAPARRTPAALVPAQRAPRGAAPGWSWAALRELGVPEQVLERLPRHDPGDDGSWLAALAQAITLTAWAMPNLDGAEVNGFGNEGAIVMLRALVVGCRPGTLTIDGVTAAATASDLAMAVRACLPR